MKLRPRLAAAMAGMFLSSGIALANPILTDLTPADYITVGGLDWAWASPVTSEVWFGQNTLSQASLHDGWREATDAEWAARPAASAFGPSSSSFKCASQYWNSTFTHCDYGDGTGGYLSQHWQASPEDSLDLWYVRDASIDVPEPGSIALVGLGLLGLTVVRKRKRS